MLGKIYLFRSRTERKVYVGQTTQADGERWSQHVIAAFCGATTPFHQAIRRLGPSDFEEEILATTSSPFDLDTLECLFIKKFQANDPAHGYNATCGGAGAGAAKLEFMRERELVRVAAKLLDPNSRSYQKGAKNKPIQLFNCYGEPIGWIRVEDALAMHGVHLNIRAKGTGRKRRFTSAKLFARVGLKWARKKSGGFIVLQLITT